MRKIYFLLLTVLLGVSIVNAQTTLISPTGDGGFETGTTFAANGWTVVNAATNTWQVGAASTPFAGSRGAYVSNNAGTSWSYTNNLIQTSHFYRDIIVPSGEGIINLSFQWKGNGESNWDRLLVYTAPITVTPVAGSPASNSTTLAGATLVYTQASSSQSAYTSATISLPSSLAGTTFRLIFTWQNDGSGGTIPPAAVDNISLTSASCSSVYSTPVSAGTYSVGTGGNYSTLGQAVNALNSLGIAGNIILELNSSYVSSSETFPITLSSNVCFSTNNSITIRPGTGVTGRSISSSNTTTIIDLNGARNWVIDGRPGGLGTTSELTIQNTSTSGATIRLINDASGNTIRYTTIRGVNTSTSSGLVLFSTALITGNSGNTIENCEIRDGAAVPAIAIRSSGTASAPNSSNIIRSNNIFNFTSTGVSIASTGAGDGWIIQSNSIYQTASRTSTLTGVNVGGGNSHGILNNFIGGTAPNAASANLVTSLSFAGINLSVGIITPTSVQGNVIKNIRSTRTGFSSSFGIYVTSGSLNIGDINGNIVGSSDPAERVEVNGDSYGYSISSSGVVNFINNELNNFQTGATPSAGQFYYGSSFSGSGSFTVSNNTIRNVTNASTPDATYNTQTIGMVVSATGTVTVSGNTITRIGSTSSNAPSANNNRVWGLLLSGTGTRTIVSRNIVSDIYGSSVGTGARCDVISLVQSESSASATFISNVIGNGTINANSDRAIFGFLLLSSSPSENKYYHNTVNISGTATGANSSYSYLRNGSSIIELRNNIFNNSRSGGTGFHVAIANAVSSGWTSSSSDFNNLSTVNPSTVGQWLGTSSSNNRTFAGWRASQSSSTPGSGGDNRSVSILPQFTSSSYLRLSTDPGVNWSLESAGTPISSVTTDIDGDTRSTTRPDIGADEFSATGFVVNNPVGVCAGNTVDITAAAVTAGTISGTTFSYFSDVAGTVTLTAPNAIGVGGTYYINATNGAGNSWIQPVVVTINPLPTPSITGAAAVCEASTGNVYSVANVAGNTYNWTVTGGTITAGQGTNSITVTWGAAGTATVTLTETITATGCVQTATRSITLNPNPTPVITGLAAVCTTNEGYVYSVPSVAGNTYAWSVGGGTITAGAGTNAITVTWGAVGAGSVTVTQTITATGCATTVSRATNIQTLPTATATVVEPVTCASEDGQINLTLGGAAGPYTFAWTGTGNGLSATTQNQPVVSTGFYNVTVTAANGCTVSVPNIVVSGPGGCFICPTIGTITSTATIICQDGANTITAGGLADLGITYGIRFKYSATPLANPYLSTAGITMGTVTNANLTVVGGTTTRTSASINYNFPTAGTMYVYAILSPASPDPACRPFLMIPVEVAPTPVLTRPADQVRCTGSATAAVNFLAAPATTTTFAWTNNRTSIGLAASGTGNIASFTATNFTNAPVTALITVTPTNTQTLGASTVVCPGPAQTYSYTINPIPTVNTVTNQSVCAGTTVSLPFSGFVTGTVYEWTNSNTAIGLAATGTGTLSYTATNNTSSPITATIIVTPKFTSAGGTCTGNPISFDITVNPTPVVDAIPAQVLCSGSATTAISLTSATTGTAFSWTNSATSVGLAGTGTGTSIASFTAVNTGAAPVNAIIRITPSYTGAGFTCTGSVGTTTITVNPIPATTGIADRVICNGAATTFTLTGPVTAAVYNWTNSNTGIGLAGTGSGTIAFTASNTTGAPITSTIEVTPSITNAGLACVGGTSSFTVTVNPSGQVNAIDNQVLCNGSATSAVTFSTVNNGLISTGGSQVASSGTISVAVPDASAVGATHTIPVTLPTGAVITNMRVTMNLTHTWISDMIINLRAPNGQVLNLFNGHGGSGDNLVNTIISSTGTASLASGTAPFTGTFAATAAIGVGPTGNASTAANFAALYSTANGNWALAMEDEFLGDLGTLTGWSIAFDYVVQGQFGTNMNWTNSLSSIGLAATGTGNIPSFTAANTTAAPVVSTVTVTPSYFNAGTSCPGAPVTFTYTVNPTPTVNTVANQVFCAGTPSTVNFSGATTGTVFNWTSSNAAIGLATSGSGNLSFTPTNTSNVPIVSTITVTPVFTNGGVTCTGTPRTFTITVNPVGQVNTVLNQVICNGAATTAVNFATVNGGGTVQVGTPVTANSGAITIAIPDASAAGTTHTLPVTLPAGATITGVSVNFNMTHTWLSDMVVNLRAPNGQILNLVNRRGGSGDNFVNTTISSESTTSLATGTAPFTGTFAADGALNVGPTTFVSTATNFAALYSVANGDWTLGMRDHAAGDNGTLTGWSITFNYTTVAGAVTTYNWTNTTPSIGLAASGVGNIASFAAANTSTVPVTATVSVIPTYTNAGVGCAGPASSFTYTVNPTPTVNAVSNQAVCRGSNVAAISFGGTVSGTVYNWTNTNTAIGLAASGTGDIASFVGANTTSAPISGTITVTPVFTNAGITCTGTPRTFTITVNPIPTVNSVASFPVCHNSVAAVTFSGATTGTVYNWTNTNTTIGLPASGTGNLNFTALNTTSAPTVATITVTPVFANAGTTCTGTPTSFTITVNPLPVVSAGSLPARICISDTLVPLNGTPVGGSWSGIGTSGMNFIPTATALGTWPITYTFSDINGCTNRATIAATVLSCDERDRDLDNSAVLLYPNPNSGQFNLRINSTRFNALGMRVFNTAGQLVSTKQWNGLVYARVVPVNLTNLPAGIYMVRLYYGDGMDRGADKTYQIVIAR